MIIADMHMQLAKSSFADPFFRLFVFKTQFDVCKTPWPSQPFAAEAANVDRVHDEDVWPCRTPKKTVFVL